MVGGISTPYYYSGLVARARADHQSGGKRDDTVQCLYAVSRLPYPGPNGSTDARAYSETYGHPYPHDPAGCMQQDGQNGHRGAVGGEFFRCRADGVHRELN